ncbi:lycopene cyclase domain-containing protein [Formosa agariphila KMM 3901]|uniref:Lycopene cyclase domain-containing protein n=1 Tax=Formosa agariphila (strain DSM 15362 / KCTC 12365 / LMG 23005 / KMM 3901 / M-2Alg 35-1) TaxID=1347342 RepID=T2KH39_FORAG|nr:lycopene cyclase domain-containing protein [Formosa agariphila]CDF78120.1 lycopene cyclase domain-containing protein [Formosa agariphila KMM 3901]
MKPFTYLLINLACISIPLVASFYPKHAFYKHWGAFFKANAIIAIFFIIWDYAFTKMGVWGFNPEYLTGVFFGELPLEEILFFVCIPFCCVFSYFAFTYLVKTNPFKSNQHHITTVLIVLTSFIALQYYNHWYTATACGLTAIYLIYLKWKQVDLSYHYLTFLFILPFFFASNGILTGSFLEAPIVWYNDAENMGIRLFTIPVEDSIYGLLLIFLNIEGFRYFESKAV